MEKSERLEIRLSPMDKHVIRSAAQAAGMTVSAYLLFKACEDIGYTAADKVVKTVEKRHSGDAATRKRSRAPRS